MVIMPILTLSQLVQFWIIYYLRRGDLHQLEWINDIELKKKKESQEVVVFKDLKSKKPMKVSGTLKKDSISTGVKLPPVV